MASNERGSSFQGNYQPKVLWVIAKYDFAGRDDTELSFKTGDLIEVLDDRGQDWWHGELRGQKKHFPVNYVEVAQGAGHGEMPTQPLNQGDRGFPAEQLYDETGIKEPISRDNSSRSDSSSYLSENDEYIGLQLQEETNRPMTPNNATKLRRKRPDIIRDLHVQDVIDFMMGQGVITAQMKEEIMAKPTRQERCSAFLDRLETRGERAFHIFMQALKADYKHLCDVIECTNIDRDLMDIYLDIPRTGESLTSAIEVSLLKTKDEGEREKKKNRVRSLIRDNRASRGSVDLSKLIERAMKLKQNEEDNGEDSSQFQAQIISTITVEDITLKTNEFVVALREDTGKPNIMYILNKRGERIEVPKSNIKSFGDPCHEKYFYRQKIMPTSAIRFIEQELKEMPLDGLFFLYEPLERASPAKYHLCVGEIGGSAKDYPIIQVDEGFVISKEHKPFDTVIDLIEYFTYTRSNVLEVPLGRCLNDVDDSIKPGADYDDKWEITTNELDRKGKRLGNGFFAIVQKTRYQGKEVAVKSMNYIHQGRDHKEQFLKEAKLLMELDHENILQLLGVRFSKEPYLIITEYLNKGTLQSALRAGRISSKDGGSLMKNVITPIASAMRYLESMKIVHRDLASRNILLGENNVIKLADFGLSRKVWSQTGKYVAMKKDTIPHRWAAPEALATLNFTIKSDVWAFGILLWEIYSGGERPYHHLKNHEIVGFVLVDDGRLDKPKKCPDDIYQTMHACWNVKLDERPSFADLHKAFDSQNLSSVRKRVSKFITETDYMAVDSVSFLDFRTYEDVYLK